MNRLSIPNRIALTGAVLCLVMGIFVFAGWWFDIPTFRGFMEEAGYMKANSAIAFGLLGAALWISVPGPVEGRRRFGVYFCIGLAGAIGALTFLEYLFGSSLGIDEFLVRDYLHHPDTPAGRMSLLSAVGFTLTAIGLALLQSHEPSVWRPTAAGMLACVIASIAVFCASGRFLDLPTAQLGDDGRTMSLRTAAGLLVLAVAFVALAHERSRLGGERVVRWLPFALGMGVLILSVLLWQAVRAQERKQIRRTVARAISNVEKLVSAEIQSRILTLIRVARRWENRGRRLQSEWDFDARLYLSHYPDMQSLEWVDSRLLVRAVTPENRERSFLDFNLGSDPDFRRLLEHARESRDVTVSGVRALDDGTSGFMVFVPILRGAEFDGLAIGVFRVTRLIDGLLGEVTQSFHVKFSEGASPVYSNGAPGSEALAWRQPGRITLPGREWEVNVWPRSATLAELRSPFGPAVLGGGSVLALLMGLAIHLAQTSLQQSRRLRASNRSLGEEVKERKQIQAALRESQERLQAIMDNTSAVIYLKDTEGRYLMINRQYEKLFGLGKTDLVGRNDYDIFPKKMADAFRANDLRVQSEGSPLTIEENAPHEDGLHTYISIKFPMRGPDGDIYGVCGISTDITDRKRAEARLRENHQAIELGRDRLKGIIEGTRDQIVALDLKYRFLAYNTGFRDIFEKRFGVAIAPEMRIHDALGRFPKELARQFDLWTRALQGDEFSFEEETRMPDGNTGYFECTFSPIRSEAGVLLGATEVIRDISDRRRGEIERNKLLAELGNRNEQLVSANKELEAFSYSVSHDLRAPLRHIDGFTGLLGKILGNGAAEEKQRRYCGLISNAARQMGRLIDDLLAFSRMGRAEMRMARVDMNSLVDEVRLSLRPDCEGRQIEWKTHSLPETVGDQTLLRQVLFNLLSNAVKYTGPCEKAVIEVGHQGTTGEDVFFVRDNGVGFDMKYIESLFGVFQRLHRAEQFEGTGIGLANVRRIIARHGGRTWAEGRVNEGATFWFSLPRKADGESPATGPSFLLE